MSLLNLSSALTAKTALISGASGFIGSHLSRRLLQIGVEVHGISRSYRPHGEKDVFWWQGDLADSETIRNILSTVKPDLIFHLASHVAGSRDLGLVSPTFRNNLLSTVNLLEVASELGCTRLLLAGSLEEPEPADPQAIPCSPYAAAKWAANTYGRMFHQLYQLPVVICRLFMVYGPQQQDLRKLIPYVILSLFRGDAPQLMSGERRVDWIYVTDVVEGLLAAAAAKNVEGMTLDIGSGTLTRVRTVVEHLVTLVNPKIEPCFGALVERPHEQVKAANVQNSLNLLGWQPSIGLKDGLMHTVDWYVRRAKEGRL